MEKKESYKTNKIYKKKTDKDGDIFYTAITSCFDLEEFISFYFEL